MPKRKTRKASAQTSEADALLAINCLENRVASLEHSRFRFPYWMREMFRFLIVKFLPLTLWTILIVSAVTWVICTIMTRFGFGGAL